MQENQNNTQNQQNTQAKAVEQSANSTANVAEDVKATEQGAFHPAQENPYTQRVYQDRNNNWITNIATSTMCNDNRKRIGWKSYLILRYSAF